MELLIREITSISEMTGQIHLLKNLTPDLTKENLESWFPVMIKNNYRMFAAFSDNKCVGLSGTWMGIKLYSGKYLEIDNFIIAPEFRGKGIGKQLTNHIVSIAKKEGCSCIMLDAYTSNTEGHRFYLREGFIIKGFHFIKYL